MARLHPVLATSDQVLLPGALTRLQISHPDGVAAIDHHLEHNIALLVVPLSNPLGDGRAAIETPDPTDLAPTGCLAQVLRAVRLGDGTVRVLIEGTERARVLSPRLDPDAGLSASARLVPERIADPSRVETQVMQLKAGLKRLLEIDSKTAPALHRVAELSYTPSRLCDLVAANLTLTWEERLAVLEESLVDDRLNRVLVALGREHEFKTLGSQVERRVQGSMDVQQRQFYLREQIRELKQELGEAATPLDETEAMEARLREAGLPEAALEEALKELERLRRMHPDAAEYNVTRTWLEWLLSLPWQAAVAENRSLAHAQKVLDEDHYGLDKVKERILEFLAVRTLKPDGKGPILCFLGPPGVGKTSLGRSIARALDRPFQRVSLGGVKDEAEIRGHRRTYVGALPGRIIHAMKRAGVRNPVIVLDEIDKLGNDFRGDPSSALLEVLDPEQNNTFTDHYLDVPFDLSQVLFLCTANLADPIPSALHDRLEIIELPGYIQEEKREIARRHLLPRLREGHGLTEAQISVTPRAVDHIIETYTSEAGLRNLERELATLHRKAARRVVEGKKRGLKVDEPEQVRALLGPPKHFPELAGRTDPPGVAIGLAWTAAGGEILFIEASLVPGGKDLKLTGQLGNVMKESVEAALTLVRNRAAAFGVDPVMLNDNGLHVHVPAGAIPKDGPSAGIVMVTALVSLLSGRPVQNRLAMTGEVTLRGRVLPVGGVREKVVGARRAGITTLILPRQNAGDLEDVPQKLRDELTFHLVDNVDEVLALALGIDVSANA
jgi:ATP-dependent Lon protease